MNYLIAFLFISMTAPAWGQQSKTAPTEKQSAAQPSSGRQKVKDAYAFQEKLADSTATIEEVLQNWRDVSMEKDVRRDADALAIVYGAEGLLYLQKGEKPAADSLLAHAMPLFRLKHSKAYFLVAFADLDRDLHNDRRAMESYWEITSTMDSMPELWDIQYYRLSGYAPYAYAIDASLGATRIALHNKLYRDTAIALLKATFSRHPLDALGAFNLVALHRLGALSQEDFDFKLNFICSKRPELREVSDKFKKDLKG